MNNCLNKVKFSCGDQKNYAECIIYDDIVNSNSSLEEGNCNTVSEALVDIYEQLDVIDENSDLSALGNDCLTFADKKIKTVLLKYEQEICLLKEKITELETTELCSRDITQCGINLTGLVDPCDAPIQTLGQLLQFLVDNINP